MKREWQGEAVVEGGAVPILVRYFAADEYWMMEGSSPSRFDRIPEDAPTAHSPGSQYWLHDGVLYGRTSSDHVRRDASFADAAFEAIRGLVGLGRRVPMLMDARKLGWLQNEWAPANARTG